MRVQLALGLTEGDSVRFLSKYFGKDKFTQRGTWDQYFVDNKPFLSNIDLEDLYRIALYHTVEITYEGVVIHPIFTPLNKNKQTPSYKQI